MKNIFYLLLLASVILSCEEPVPSADLSDTIPSSPVMCAPALSDSLWYQSSQRAPLFAGLGDLGFNITTTQDSVQQYFNQGLVLAYGFNHAEAARSFYYATQLDTTCAMAYWGYAYVLGPNYNAGMESTNYQRAFQAIEKAKTLVVQAGTDKERALIEALATRYVAEPVADRAHLDSTYAHAMRLVFTDFPEDADVGTLYAEALMDLHPWDLWDKNGGAKPWTPPIVETLERVLKLDSLHPGAHHLYIHAVEASHSPDRGLRSARLFDEGLVPGAGHLLHMPSHIYIRTGHYHRGSLANIAAVQADSNYVTACRAQGAYPLIYHPHNYHFLAATATLAGDQLWAVQAIEEVARQANGEMMKAPEWGLLQHYYAIRNNVYVKFGMWDEILQIPLEDTTLLYPSIVQHYARGMAYLAKQNVVAAKAELASLQALADDKRIAEITFESNDIRTLVDIPEKVLAGEIKARAGNIDEGIELLKQAVALEDGLNYIEPPDWFFSVRHHLGAVMVEAGRYEDAIEVYKRDLEVFPRNGWALHGLREAYQGLNWTDQAEAIEKQLQVIWAESEVSLPGSRIL